jgi:hypothetical protein
MAPSLSRAFIINAVNFSVFQAVMDVMKIPSVLLAQAQD